jgi:hypothetical protein
MDSPSGSATKQIKRMIKMARIKNVRPLAALVAAALRTEGFAASNPKPADPGYVEDVGGHSWDLKIGEGKGRSPEMRDES